MPDVSIIIPTLNEAEGITAAVERAWACQPREVLVVDGGSQDDTPAAARRAGAKVISCQRGRALQQNVGVRHATGKIFLFLHADTWLAADGCRQIETALTDSRVACGGFHQQIEASGGLYRALEWGNAWRVRRLGLPYGDQGIFLRRDTFEAAGGFPSIRLMEDWLLMRRLRKTTWPILLPGPLHVSPRRWQRHGIVRQTLRNWSLVAAATAGISPDSLARFYQPHQPHAALPMDGDGA